MTRARPQIILSMMLHEEDTPGPFTLSREQVCDMINQFQEQSLMTLHLTEALATYEARDNAARKSWLPPRGTWQQEARAIALLLAAIVVGLLLADVMLEALK